MQHRYCMSARINHVIFCWHTPKNEVKWSNQTSLARGMEVVCNRAAGLPAVPVLLLSGQGIVTNHGWKFHFLPFCTSHSHANDHAKKCSREVFPLLAYCSDCVGLLSIFLAGRCWEGLKSVLKNPSWQMPKTWGVKMRLNRNLNHGLWNLINVREKYGRLSIVLLCLCKQDELDSSFRHNPVTCLVRTPEARKPAKTSSQVPPYSNELLFLCSQGCLLAGLRQLFATLVWV